MQNLRLCHATRPPGRVGIRQCAPQLARQVMGGPEQLGVPEHLEQDACNNNNGQIIMIRQWLDVGLHSVECCCICGRYTYEILIASVRCYIYEMPSQRWEWRTNGELYGSKLIFTSLTTAL